MLTKKLSIRRSLIAQTFQVLTIKYKEFAHTSIIIRPPSKREIMEAIKAMKKGKAAGIDNIPAEILQVDRHLSTEMLYPLFLDIWKKERFPKDWKEGIVVKIP
jgi:hypothetical protein